MTVGEGREPQRELEAGAAERRACAELERGIGDMATVRRMADRARARERLVHL